MSYPAQIAWGFAALFLSLLCLLWSEPVNAVILAFASGVWLATGCVRWQQADATLKEKPHAD